eukprot:1225553-Amorphochlora_amoeboformis.AAC.1
MQNRIRAYPIHTHAPGLPFPSVRLPNTSSRFFLYSCLSFFTDQPNQASIQTNVIRQIETPSLPFFQKIRKEGEWLTLDSPISSHVFIFPSSHIFQGLEDFHNRGHVPWTLETCHTRLARVI